MSSSEGALSGHFTISGEADRQPLVYLACQPQLLRKNTTQPSAMTATTELTNYINTFFKTI